MSPQNPKGGSANHFSLPHRYTHPQNKTEISASLNTPSLRVAQNLPIKGSTYGAPHTFHGKPLPVSHPTPSARKYAEAGVLPAVFLITAPALTLKRLPANRERGAKITEKNAR
jgi:hypothetical protein